MADSTINASCLASGMQLNSTDYVAYFIEFDDNKFADFGLSLDYFMNKKVFVTGATGNIGSVLIKKLEEQNTDFIAGISTSGKSIEGVKCTVINFAELDSLKRAFENIDTLFLLIPDAEQMFDWAKNAVEAAKQVGLSHIIRSSGLGADSKSEYAILKHLGEIEDVIVQSGLDYTFIRPNSFMQNFATFDSHAIKTGTFYSARGNAKISYVDTRDIAAAVATVLRESDSHKGKSYEVTGSKALTNYEVVEIIGKHIGKEVKYVPVSDEAAIETMRQFQMPQWTIDEIISLYQADKNGITSVVSSAVKDLTDKEPTTFEKFVEDYAEAWT